MPRTILYLDIDTLDCAVGRIGAPIRQLRLGDAGYHRNKPAIGLCKHCQRGLCSEYVALVDDPQACKDRPLTHSRPWHRIPPNMYKHGFGTMSMTTTSGFSREGFVIGQN